MNAGLRICLGLTAAAFCWLAVADEVDETQRRAISLLDAYELAIDSAPDLGIARYRVDSAAARRDVAKGQVMPQLSAFGQWSENKLEYRGATAAGFGDQDYPGERYGFQFRQTIFNMARWSEYDRQVALYEQSEDQLKSVEMTVFAAVTEAYFNVLLTDITAVQFEEELTALETQLQEASALYDRGFLPITQVLETQTRVDTVRADLIAARGQAAVAKERLMSLLGQRGIDPIPVTENLLLPTDIHSGDLAAELGVANSPDVAAALDMLNAAREAVSRERGTWLPEVDLVVSQQYSDVGFDNLSSPPRTTESIAIAVNFPLLEGGSGSARLRGAWADFYGAQQELEAAKRDADMRARSAWVEYESAQQRLVAAKQALKTASVTVEAAQKAVKAGTSRITEVLLALARRTLTQRDYNAARFQYAMSWLELELSTGSHPDRLAPRLSAALVNNAR